MCTSENGWNEKMKIDFDRDDRMEEAYEVYFKILSEAVQEGRTQELRWDGGCLGFFQGFFLFYDFL